MKFLCVTNNDERASVVLEKVQALAEEIHTQTLEASHQGGIMRTAEQAQLRALDKKYHAELVLIDTLRGIKPSTYDLAKIAPE